MDTLAALLALLVVLVVIAFVARAAFDVVTVHDYERGLRYTRGRFRGLVDPGTYVTVKPLTEIRLLDARPAHLTVEGQEILLADGTSIKVSIAARYVLGDAVAVVTGDRDAYRALYLLLQLGLRDAVSGRSIDEVLSGRADIGPQIRERVASDLAKIGLELLSVEVRDLMLTGELRRAFAAVVAARKDGQAALERARSETATLRNLANAGRMVEDNPGLLQLRLFQQLGASTGNTIMMGMPDGVTSRVASATSRTRTRIARPVTNDVTEVEVDS